MCTGPVPTCGNGGDGGVPSGGGGSGGAGAGGAGTPVILIDTQTWSCTPDCSNGGDYDQVTYGGMNVCIPR